ncbi:Conserved oligomeric Golgi complex subunit 6 [Lucilia cuprina]|uniref:Conserved oligomeric Golgi complex subunit 6 n=1 Tax=Lucilia cuprina TaxID=7375 RepID=A0A0L0C1L7_LUCCU|nr:conserved oligomeric Golgi complex subunit 6 [Lucilia cuprina]KAI8127146.1 Conserved oligomeric Golgi complex subunit 6 [Lucilia cuprina]KNC26146.1 Conserved oligomeric Golgi complex subunit 6 [Lucilia cuprina]
MPPIWNMEEDEGDRLQKRINKILETRLDTEKDTLEALKDSSNFFVENTLQNRRNLRSQIEKRSVNINENFLRSFREVKLSLDAVCNDLDTLSSSVQAMKNDLESSKALTHDLIKQTNDLQEQREHLQVHKQVAEAFLARFQLSIPEHQILYGTSKDSAITAEFFDVLDRVQNIHAECRVLMQCGYQTAAEDIMEEMTLHQEGALERLYRWTQNHCRNLDNNEIGPLVIRAMGRLQDRPVLFKYVIDEYAIARRAVLVRLFIDALTEGGPGGNPKPIEMHAHDPKRYIGDMFAWLHQAIPIEKENSALLFKMCHKNDLSEQMQNALAYIADGVCHPLKVRVETILNSEKDTIVLFAISNLLRFYQQIMKQVVQGGSLEQCLSEMQKSSEEIYLNSLSNQVRQILQKNAMSGSGLEPPQRDLVPPSSLGRLLNLLKEILSVATMVDGRQSDITKIISCIIDPLLQSVQESASHLPTVDMAVYLLNCLYHMQSTLAVYEYMDERVERLQAQSEAQIDTLTSEQASSLVSNLQLGPIYTILQTNQSKIESNLLKIFMNKMDAFLEMPEVLLLPQIQLIMSSSHRTAVQKRSFNVIVAIYKQIYERIHDPENGFEHPESIFSKTPQQVAKILSV